MWRKNRKPPFKGKKLLREDSTESGQESGKKLRCLRKKDKFWFQERNEFVEDF